MIIRDRIMAAIKRARRAGGYSLYLSQGYAALYCADICECSRNKLRWLEAAERLFLDHVATQQQSTRQDSSYEN